MAHFAAIISLLALLAPPAVASDCSEEAGRAEALRAQTVEGMDRSREAMEALEEAARSASLCFENVDPVESARWYSFDIWVQFALRKNSSGLARVAEYRSKVAGLDAATDAAVFTYEGGFLLRLSRLDEAMSAYSRALIQARSSANAYRIAITHVSMAELARRMNRPERVFHHLDRADSVALNTDFDQAAMVQSIVAHRRVDALLHHASVMYALDSQEVAGLRSRLMDAAAWAEATGDALLRDQSMLTLFEFDRHMGKADEIAEAAEAYYARHIRDRGDRLEMTWLNELSNIDRERGEVSRAANYLRASYELVEELYELEFGARVANRLARLLEFDGDFEDARRWYRIADEVYSQHLHEGGSTELLAAAFTRSMEPLRQLALLQLRMGHPEEAFQSLERARLQFLARLRQQSAFVSDRDRRRADSLIGALREVRSELAGRSNPDDRAALELAESRLLVEVGRAFPDFQPVRDLDMRTLQRRLGENNHTLLSYLVLPEATWIGRPAHAYAFVVSSDTFAAVPLATEASALEALVRDALPTGDEASGGFAAANGVSLEALKTLHDVLISPVQPFIADGSRLVISPDGPLFHLPFAALVRRYEGRFDFSKAHYLVSDHALSVELSAALYLDPGGAGSGRRNVVAFARSQFDEDTAMVGALVDLPSVDREVRAIRSAVSGTRVLKQEQATPTALYAALSGAGVVHVATHATVDPGSMLNHAIVLHPDASRASGVVYAFDLLRRHFGTPLVVLSACATAAGPMIGGEGPAGLQYGFRASGVGSVLATHWLVEDESMAKLTSRFYENLARGLPKDEALQRAQLELIRRDDGFAHPMFWAAPVLYGDSSAIPVRPNRSRLYASALAILLLGSGVLLRHRVRNRKGHISYT